MILTSESYEEQTGALHGVKSCEENLQKEERFERKVSKDNNPRTKLKASNGQAIGKSETYSGVSALENGIALVKANGATTTIAEQYRQSQLDYDGCGSGSAKNMIRRTAQAPPFYSVTISYSPAVLNRQLPDQGSAGWRALRR